MALQTSGAISLQQIQNEFGGSHPISLSEYYSAASGIPASGQISISNFYGAANVIAITLSNSTNVNLQTTFGSNWASSTPKQITIPSGVTIGGTGSSDALIVPTGMGGTLNIINSGSVIGFGGQAGAAGGNAIRINSASVTVTNSGLIAGGGGGGGAGGSGGTGGSGFADSGVNGAFANDFNSCSNPCPSVVGQGGSPCFGNYISVFTNCSTQSCCMGDGTRRRCGYDCYGPVSGASGGGGGAGGRGQGYNQTRTNGSGGSAGASGSGGTYGSGSGGTGGTGGNGGTYGNAGGSGATGASGANGYGGNGSGGSGGAAGGAAGRAVIKTVSFTLNNSGTINGAT